MNTIAADTEAPNATKVPWNDTLIALVEQGPVWDGDIPSKRERDELVEQGLASRALVKGEDGFTVATYLGREHYCAMFGVATLSEAMAKRQRMQEDAQLDREVQAAIRALEDGPWYNGIDLNNPIKQAIPAGTTKTLAVNSSPDAMLAAETIIATIQKLHAAAKQARA